VAVVAKFFATRSDFQKGAKGAYLNAYRGGYLDEVCRHMPLPKTAKTKPRTKWTKELVVARSKPFDTRSDFQNAEASAYQAARKNGWVEDACAHMVAPPRRHWSEEELTEALAACYSITELMETNPQAYTAARRRGIFEKAGAHLTRKLRTLTDVDIVEIAKTYETRKAFERDDSSAYVLARGRGILEECCAHMAPATRNGDSDLVNVYVFENAIDYYVGVAINPKERRQLHLSSSRTLEEVRALIEFVGQPQVLTWAELPTFVECPEGVNPTSIARIPRKVGNAVERHLVAANIDRALNRNLRPKAV
jgi:hypothetical protein